jgi:hypothetical protein
MNALDSSFRPASSPTGYPPDDADLRAVRTRLLAIAATAETAAGALGAGAVDWLPAELERFAHQLERVGDRLADIADRLAVGVDPQGAGPSDRSTPNSSGNAVP